MLAQPCVLVFAAIVMGIVVAEACGPQGMLCASACGVGLACVYMARRCGRGTVAASLLTLAAASAWATTLVPYPPASEPVCAPEGGLWQVVVAAPIDRRPTEAAVRQQTTVRLLAERCLHTWAPRQGTARLLLQPGVSVARGDLLAVRLRVGSPAPRHHLFELPSRERQRRQRLTHQAQVLSEHTPLVAGSGLLARIDRLRTRGAIALEQHLAPEHAALAKALALGDTGAISPGVRETWASAGVAHLLSVSGLHVGIVAALGVWLARQVLMRLPGAGERYSARRAAALTALLPLVGFCILTGAHAAALRATCMAACALSGLVLGHRNVLANAWGMAGALMLLADPMALYDVGFVLSFAAVGALVWLVPKAQAPEIAPEAHWTQKVWVRLRSGVRASWQVSLAASCATAPITAWAFNRVCWVAPLVNLVAVPLGSLVATPWALAMALLGPYLGAWQAQAMQPLGWCLGLLDGIATWAARLPGASLDIPTPKIWELLVWCAFVLALYASGVHRRRARWGAALLGCMLLGALGIRAAARYGDGQMWVRHLYVGQGDATLVTLPKGGVVLIDGGGSVHDAGADPGRQAVAPTLRRLGIRSIDWMVLTHPHPDHLGGLHYIADNWRVGHLLLGGGGIDYAGVQALAARVRKSGGQVLRVRDMPRTVRWEGVQVDILHPRAGSEDCYPSWHLNDNSVVLRMQWKERSILLVGDIERRAESALAALHVRADVLKVGHHGSRTSSTLPFLQAVAPHTAIISCGFRNRFGFPHQETLERLSMHNIRTLRTDMEGSITLRTDGRAWFVSGVQQQVPMQLCSLATK